MMFIAILAIHAHYLEYESIPKLIEPFQTIYRCLELILNVGPWIKRKNELKIWLETKDMDKTVGLDIKTIFQKFSKSKFKMMLYKCFYVFKNLKNIFLDWKFKKNEETKNQILKPKVGAQARIWALKRRFYCSPAPKRPYERPSAHLRPKFCVLGAQAPVWAPKRPVSVQNLYFEF